MTFLSHLLCQQLADFARLEPEPQQLHLQSDAAFLPIHAGYFDGSRPAAAAVQHVSHGEKDSELCPLDSDCAEKRQKTHICSPLRANVEYGPSDLSGLSRTTGHTIRKITTLSLVISYI